jgi:hypothetical protein
MKNLLSVLAILSLTMVPGSGAGQSNPFRTKGLPPPDELTRGRIATVDLMSGSVRGELLSVSVDSLWVLSDSRTVAFPLRDVRAVRVRMHKWGWGRMLAWNVLAGLGSAAALSAACRSVEGTANCRDVFLGWSLGWSLIGGITGAFIATSSHRTLEPAAGALRPFVRLPQRFLSNVDSLPGPRRTGWR